MRFPRLGAWRPWRSKIAQEDDQYIRKEVTLGGTLFSPLPPEPSPFLPGPTPSRRSFRTPEHAGIASRQKRKLRKARPFWEIQQAKMEQQAHRKATNAKQEEDASNDLPGTPKAQQDAARQSKVLDPSWSAPRKASPTKDGPRSRRVTPGTKKTPGSSKETGPKSSKDARRGSKGKSPFAGIASPFRRRQRRRRSRIGLTSAPGPEAVELLKQ